MIEDDPGERVRIGGMLKHALLRRMPRPGQYAMDVAGFSLVRHDEANRPQNCFSRPLVAVIVQGTKRSVIGSVEYCYGEGQCLVAGVDMPSWFYVTEASPEQPFLALSLELDAFSIAQLAAEVPPPAGFGGGPGRGISLAEADSRVLDAFLRLVELLDHPEGIPVLAPLIVREIHYRLLAGPQGGHLRGLNTLGTQGNQIAQAITWLRDNYRQPLHVEALARMVNMAASTFHRHFKEVTTLSPLQFHKRLRLYEAQRLMLAENENAAGAALAVGYESSTQFSREYKRLFGEPPHRDVSRRGLTLAADG